MKRMGITEILGKIWLLSANKIKSSEFFSKQPTQRRLNSSLRHIIVTISCKSWKGVKVEIKKRYNWNCSLKPSQGFGPQINTQPTRWQHPLINYPAKCGCCKKFLPPSFVFLFFFGTPKVAWLQLWRLRSNKLQGVGICPLKNYIPIIFLSKLIWLSLPKIGCDFRK